MSFRKRVATACLLAAVAVFSGRAFADEPASSETGASETDHYKGRLRIGFNVNGGWGFGDGFAGPTAGATFRIGWQFNGPLGLYYQGSPYVWLGARSSDSSADVGAIAGVQNGVLLSWTPIDLLE